MTPRRATRQTVRIGITGPIGCGKSAVGRWLAAAGGVLVDADQVTREVTGPGMPALDAILERFGPAVTRPDGSLDRKALARIVFADADRLRELETIVHPVVRPAILERIATAESAGAPLVAIEAIRLVESGLNDLCDEVWLVVCDPTEQRGRVVARGLEPADAEQRIAAHDGLADRLRPHATRVLDTSGPEPATRDRVMAALDAALGTARDD